MFYNDQNGECIKFALIRCFTLKNARRTFCLLSVSFIISLLLYQSVFFYVYCEDLLFYGNSSVPFVSEFL